jgi:hypothetical protein
VEKPDSYVRDRVTTMIFILHITYHKNNVLEIFKYSITLMVLSTHMKITYKSLEISHMTHEHISQCIDLWVSQFKEARETVPSLPLFWGENTNLIQSYLEQHSEKNHGIVAHSHGTLVGYMTYVQFKFHGEETAISPVVGHASVPQNRVTIYREMYRFFSDVWVSKGALSHIITSFTNDKNLVDSLFHLGFGVYVVDSFRDISPIITDSEVSVRNARFSDLTEVKRLDSEFKEYFLQAPVFLVTKQKDDEYYSSLLSNQNGTIFVTGSDDHLTGGLYIRENDESDAYSLAAKGVGKIDKFGAFVEESSRGSGNALVLLKAAVDWCTERGIDTIHVDYESANLLGSGFWSKNFTPTLYSLKRKVNQDILD